MHVVFPTQIIVTGEIDAELPPWLNALSGKLKKQDIRTLPGRAGQRREAWEKEAADSVLQVCLGANRELAGRLKKEDNEMHYLQRRRMRCWLDYTDWMENRQDDK